MSPLLFDSASGNQTPDDLPELSNATYFGDARRRDATSSLADLSLHHDLPSWIVAPADDEDAPLIDAPRQQAAATHGFKLRRMVGRGGMGEVWSALQGTLQRPVAVKRLRSDVFAPQSPHYARAVGDFQLEAMVAGRLEHPNIVPIHDLGADERGRPLIAMKLVEGDTWSDVLQRDRSSMPPPEFLAKHLPILLGMANAVAFAHDRGIVHRDLKPSQVMVGAYGEVLLMDWGLAIAWKENPRVDAPELSLPHPPTATSPAGTPAFMAPEQTRDDAAGVGPHTDVFLLGGKLYFLLTGTFPYMAATSQGAFLQARTANQQRPEERTPDRWIPKELADIAMRAMAPDPSQRHASAGEFHRAVNDWITGAAQRREAQSLLEQATAMLAANPDSYAAFNAVINTLDKARGFWPDAPGASSMRHRALDGYAQKALTAGDLTLARAQAENLHDAARREELLQAIDEAAQRVGRNERQRRWALRATVALLTALLFSGALFTWRLSQTSAAVAIQRDRAIAARAEGEELIRFMLSDLRSRLSRIGRSDILDAVFTKIGEMLDRRKGADVNDEELMSRSFLLSQMAEVYTSKGEWDKASGALEQAEQILNSMIMARPDNPALHRIRVDVLESKASLESNLGDDLAATRTWNELIAIVERCTVMDPSMEEEDTTDIISALAVLTDRYAMLGLNEEAEASILRALKLVERRIAHQPDNSQRHVDLAEILVRWAEALERADRPTEALAAIKRAESASDTACEKQPTNMRIRHFRTRILTIHARMENSLGNSSAGEAIARQATKHIEEVMAMKVLDTGALEMEGDVATILTDSLIQLRKLEEAMRVIQTSIENHDYLARIDPTSSEWQAGYIASVVRAAAIAELMSPGATNAWWQKAVERVRSIAQTPSVRPQMLGELGEEIFVAGNRANSLGLTALARIETQESIRLFRSAMTMKPTTKLRGQLCEALFLAAQIESAIDDRDATKAAIDELLVAVEEWKRAEPGDARAAGYEGRSHFDLGLLDEDAGRLDEAGERYRRAGAVLKEALAAKPGHLPYRMELAACHRGLGSIYQKKNQRDEAMAEYTAAIELLSGTRPSVRAKPDRWGVELAASQRRLGALLMEGGRLDEAEPLIRNAAKLMRASADEGYPGIVVADRTLADLEAALRRARDN